MARIAGGRLAAEVSRSGGLGFLGAGYGDAGWLDTEMDHVPNGAQIGIGLITWHMADTAIADALGHQPHAIWLSFGDPTPHLPEISAAGVIAVCQVARVAEAEVAIRAGAEVIVAQGSEAGGHGQTGRSLFGLLPEIAASFPEVPLVAAGAINDEAGLNAALALGAWGVSVGTAFTATTEATETDAAKAKLVSTPGDDTIQSRVYDHVRGPLWPEKYVGRSVVTELTDQWAVSEHDIEKDLEEIRERYVTDVAESNMDRRVLWAGDGIGQIRNLTTAEAIVQRFPEA